MSKCSGRIAENPFNSDFIPLKPENFEEMFCNGCQRKQLKLQVRKGTFIEFNPFRSFLKLQGGLGRWRKNRISFKVWTKKSKKNVINTFYADHTSMQSRKRIETFDYNDWE
jgi:hypothetical protein